MNGDIVALNRLVQILPVSVEIHFREEARFTAISSLNSMLWNTRQIEPLFPCHNHRCVDYEKPIFPIAKGNLY
jgi:hypothetical protein